MGRSGSFWKTGAYCAIVFGSIALVGELYGFGPPHTGGQEGGFMKEVMTRMDVNKDGTITHQEMEAFHKQHFSIADANSDGQLTQDEFLTAESRDEVRQQARYSRMMSIFTGLDQNSDGVLSSTEAQAMVTERFKQLDANGDGMITQEEIQAKRRFGLR